MADLGQAINLLGNALDTIVNTSAVTGQSQMGSTVFALAIIALFVLTLLNVILKHDLSIPVFVIAAVLLAPLVLYFASLYF